MKARRRGTGRLYQQPGSSNWMMKYYVNGRCIRRSTGTPHYPHAQQQLNHLLGKVAEGTHTNLRLDRIRIDELMEPYFRAVALRASEDAGTNARQRWANHLESYFRGRLVVNITTDVLTDYADRRLAGGAERATCNRELAVIRGAMKLAAEATPPKLLRVPKFPSLKETNVRTGFVDDGQYSKLVAQNPPLWMRAVMEIGYEYGWREHEIVPNRVRGQLAGGLKVRHINLSEHTISLDPMTTKNDDGRLVAMTGAIHELLTECVRGKGPEDYVFTRPDGKVVVNFDRTWKRITKGAGLPHLLFHDMRRSSIRNMVRAGISERVAMTISGHKTRKIFDRYHIVPPRDLEDAARKSEARRQLEAQAAASAAVVPRDFGHDFGHDSPQHAPTPATKVN